MAKTNASELSRRERQIMDIIYQRQEATVAEVLKDLADPPSYSSVRALLSLLDKKGHVKYRQDGPRYVYSSIVPRAQAQDSALRRLLRTFFDGSAEEAVAALLAMDAKNISAEELERLSAHIEASKKKGR